MTLRPARTVRTAATATALAFLMAACSSSPQELTPSAGPTSASAASTSAAAASSTATSSTPAASAAVEQIYAAATSTAAPSTPDPSSPAVSIGTPTNETTPWRVQVLQVRAIPASGSEPPAATRIAVRLAITSADGRSHPTLGQYPFNAARTTRDLFAGFAPLRLLNPATGWFAHPVRLRANNGSADLDETLATGMPVTISATPFVADLTFPAPSTGAEKASELTLQLPGMPDIPNLRPQP